jgi:ATP-dependent Clp protease ATP-binding subunit ClpA
LNRIDEIVVFNRLSEENIRKIAENMLKVISQRISDNGITLSFEPALVEHLAKTGFDPVYGARPLRRQIQKTVEDSFSECLLENKFQKGDKVSADFDGEKIVYKKLD